MQINIYRFRSSLIFLLLIILIAGSCKHPLSPKEIMIQKIKGEWIEVRRTNTHNSIFNEHFGTFYSPNWDMTITDSNYIFIKIKDSSGIKKYPYDIYYDSIVVLGTQYQNNLFRIKKVDSAHLVLARLPVKGDPPPQDTILYHFLPKKYYQHLTFKQKNSLSALTRQDTLYVLHLINTIILCYSPMFGQKN